MNNLVMGVALNYDIEHVKAFVQSLRKHYDGKIVFLISDTSDDFDYYVKLNEIETYKIPNSRNQDEICSSRHVYYKKIIEEKNVEKVLLTDVRDVIFQDDPFKHEMQSDMEFFYEKKKLSDCECHRHWYVDLNIYGREEYEKWKDEYIICAGTTIGKKQAVLDYLQKMIDELNIMSSKLNRHLPDQPTHQYLIYNHYIENYKCFHTGNGPIATLNGITDIKMDQENNMLNDDGSIVAVVHQWDRINQKELFYNKAIS